MIEWVGRCTWRQYSSVFGDTLGDCDGPNIEMHSKIIIRRVWRCTWRPWSHELGGHNGGSLEIHLEAVMEQVWRCTCRPWSSEVGDALGGHDRASLEIRFREDDRANLQAVIEWVWRYTWRPWSCELGDTLGGSDRAWLDEYSEAVEGRRTGCWDSMHKLVHSQPWECDKSTLPLCSHRELADGCQLCRGARRKLKLNSGVNL